MGRLRRRAVAAVATASLLYVAAAGYLTLDQRRYLFPGAFAPAAALGAPPPGFAAIVVDTPDGERLRALWKPPAPGCGVVLSFHGNGDVPERPAARFGEGPWAADRWGVMAIAYRGYGGSTGTATGAGIAVDAVAAYDAVVRLAPGAPVLVHGHSLGTWPAVAAASARPAVALYLEAPFRSMASLVESMFAWLPTALLLRDPMRSDLAIARVRAPVVIVHGERDGVVPLGSGRALAAAGPPGTVFDAVPADHMSVLGREDALWEPRFAAMVGRDCRRPAASGLSARPAAP